MIDSAYAALDIIIYLVLGLVGGTATEQVAKRRFWPPLWLIAAVIVAFGGALVGTWFFGSVLGLAKPDLFGVPIIPALVGLIIFMIPWFIIRGGYAPTKYSQTHTWQRPYKR